MRPGAVAWTADINMTSGGFRDHGGPSKKSNPESEPSLPEAGQQV